jgi:hypothetical protein
LGFLPPKTVNGPPHTPQADSIRTNRTNGSLVRIVTTILPNESEQSAEARAVSFTQQIAPELPRFIPN